MTSERTQCLVTLPRWLMVSQPICWWHSVAKSAHHWVVARVTIGTLHQILNPVTVTWPKIAIFEIQDLENRLFGHYSLTDCPISAKFCRRKQNGMLTKATGQKMQMCKIQDGGRTPFWKSLNRHISVKNCSILMKFGTHQILNPVSHVTKKWNFVGIQDGGNRHLEIRFFGHKSSTYCSISAKFCMGNRMACRQRPHDKNCKFSKSNMEYGRHFENR